MAQVGWHGELHADKVEEYSTKHREIWPEMVQMLKDAGVRNYSIFVTGTRVFGYYECDDPEASRQHQASAEVTQRWAKHMEGLFTPDGIGFMDRVMYIE
jgi:L-rhamnose mutarotase